MERNEAASYQPDPEEFDLGAFLSEGQRIARMGNWSWDLVTGELRWSEQVFHIFGHDPESFIPTSEAFWEAVHPRDRPALEEQAWRVLRHGGLYSSDYRVIRSDGEERILHEIGEVQLSPGGESRRMAGTVQDVTEWRRAEESLRIKNAALDATITPVIIGDLDYRVFYANQAFLDHMGYTEKEVLGKDGLSLAQDPERVRSILKQVARGEPWRGELQGVTAAGQLFDAEASFALVRDARGEPHCYIVSFTDITPYRRSQRLVREAARDWQRTFDSIDSPVLVVRQDGRIQRSNRAARECLGGEEPRDLAELGNAEPWLGARRLAARCLDSGQVLNRQVEDEAGRTWDLSTSPKSRDRDDEEREARVILVLRDITRLVELQRSLRRSEQMSAMGSLVAGVAHEVRNPLFGISASVDTVEHVMAEQLKDDQGLMQGLGGDVVDCLEVLRSEVERMRVLMEDLLEYGRPAELELEPGALEEVLADVLRAPGRGRHVAVEVRGPLPRVCLDTKRMAQVFGNLVDNALEHQEVGIRASDGGRGAGGGAPGAGSAPVTLRCATVVEDGRRWLECRVEDEGPGFPPQHLDRLWEPFYSLRTGGTGLGLSIVQRIVEQHGGLVSLANREGGGARVTVRLPCPEQAKEGSGPEEGEA